MLKPVIRPLVWSIFIIGHSTSLLAQNTPSNLQDTLNQYATDAGINIYYAPQNMGNPPKQGAKKQYTSDAKLNTLLQSNGLEAQTLDGKNYTIHVAQNQMTKDDAVTDLGEVLVIGNRKSKQDLIYEKVGTRYELDAPNIERFRGTSTGDFLKSIPGVQIGDNRNSGAVDINIRGMQGMNRVPVVIDGSLQSTTVYRGYAGVASRNYFDPDLITAVTVEKGPTAAADGIGATGGIARMSTISAKDILEENQDFGMQIKGDLITNVSSVPAMGTIGGYQSQFISKCSDNLNIETIGKDNKVVGKSPCEATDGNLNDTVKRPNLLKPGGGSGSIAIAKKWNGGDILFAYAKRKQGNYHAGKKGKTPQVIGSKDRIYNYITGEWMQLTNATFDSDSLNRFRAGEEIVNTSMDNQSFLLKSTLNLTDSQALELGYMKYKSQFGELMPSLVLRGEGAYQAPLSHVDVDTITARHRWTPMEHDWIDLKTDLYLTKTQSSVINHYKFSMYSYPNEHGDPARVIYPQGFWEKSLRKGLNVSNRSEFSGKLGQFNIEYGIAFNREDLSPLGDVVKKGADIGGGALENREGWRKEWSGFFNTRYQPTDWLELNASLRYLKAQNHDNRQYYIHDGCAYVGRNGKCSRWNFKWANRETQNYTATTPIINVLFKPTDHLQFYALYAEAARAPSLFEDSKGFSFTPRYEENLKVEKAKNWELGMNYSQNGWIKADDKVRFKLSYFNNTTKDYLTRLTPASGAESMYNLDHVTFKGWEMSGGYDIGSWYANAAVAYFDETKVCRKGDSTGINQSCYPGGAASSYIQAHIPPKLQATLNVGARLFNEKLDIGTRITRVGRRAADLSRKETANSVMPIPNWGSYTLVDLYGNYDINKKASVYMAIDNATDRYYMDALSLALMPSPGRTIRAGFKMKF